MSSSRVSRRRDLFELDSLSLLLSLFAPLIDIQITARVARDKDFGGSNGLTHMRGWRVVQRWKIGSMLSRDWRDFCVLSRKHVTGSGGRTGRESQAESALSPALHLPLPLAHSQSPTSYASEKRGKRLENQYARLSVLVGVTLICSEQDSAAAARGLAAAKSRLHGGARVARR